MRILAIPGSVRRDSHNARLLRHAAERAPAGVEIEVWDGLKSIPPYDEDDDGPIAPGRPGAIGPSSSSSYGGIDFRPSQTSISTPAGARSAAWRSRRALCESRRTLPGMARIRISINSG